MLFSADTDPEVRRLLTEHLRAMTVVDRARATAELVNLGLAMARRDPGTGAPLARREFLGRWLGRELADRVLEWEQDRGAGHGGG